MVNYFKYDTSLEWADEVAEHIAIALASDIRKYGRASVALSGGNSPKVFLEKLASYRLAWENVVITLVDERHVPHDHEASNERLIREFFLEKGAGATKFIPLYRDAEIVQNVAILNQNMILNDIHYSVIVLGMGEDGHIASLFPMSDNIDVGLFDPINLYSHQIAPDFPEDRITMNLCAFAECKKIFIPILGEKKAILMERAREHIDRDLPISFVLSTYGDKVTIFEA
ncbi:MAG: 6-phosphogluconolactonase [Pseudomonadota bacterium]